MNRGSDIAEDLRSGMGMASMRPRFMNRGSGQTVQADFIDPEAARFNEAPIHESGKLVDRNRRAIAAETCVLQ